MGEEYREYSEYPDSAAHTPQATTPTTLPFTSSSHSHPPSSHSHLFNTPPGSITSSRHPSPQPQSQSTHTSSTTAYTYAASLFIDMHALNMQSTAQNPNSAASATPLSADFAQHPSAGTGVGAGAQGAQGAHVGAGAGAGCSLTPPHYPYSPSVDLEVTRGRATGPAAQAQASSTAQAPGYMLSSFHPSHSSNASASAQGASSQSGQAGQPTHQAGGKNIHPPHPSHLAHSIQNSMGRSSSKSSTTRLHPYSRSPSRAPLSRDSSRERGGGSGGGGGGGGGGSGTGGSGDGGSPPKSARAGVKRRQKYSRTRTGCLSCRQRRIKCDEERPVCHRCVIAKKQVCHSSPHLVTRERHRQR